MADLFIVKARLRFSLMLAGVGIILSALATWHFYGQIEFETDRNSFLLSAVITGAFCIAWVGLLLFYLSARRIVNPAHSFTDRFDRIPWWIVKVMLVVAAIGSALYFIRNYSDDAQNEMELIRLGHLDVLEERIQEQPALLEQTNADGLSLLQRAYRENYTNAVALLINSGAGVADLDPEGRNPIIASLGNLPMLGTLLNCNLNPDLSDAAGIPVVHHAVVLESAEALELLLDAGAKIDGRDRLSRTPLMRAVEKEALPMVGMLIEHGADVNAFDQRGDITLHFAVRRRNPELIRLLLQHGADPRTFNFTHLTPLHLAALGGQTEITGIFLEQPNMTELHDEADQTPLDFALKARKYETANLLIENGANLDRTFSDGSTRLHRAILAKDYRTARFLIRAGASATIPDADSRTANDIIRIKELHGLADLLAERDQAGADSAPAK